MREVCLRGCPLRPLFDCAVSTLKGFGLNPDKLNVELGMTAVLHTHARDKAFHPHVHRQRIIFGAKSRRRPLSDILAFGEANQNKETTAMAKKSNAPAGKIVQID